MLQCHYSEPAREKIAKLQAQGTSDEGVIQSFIQEQGLSALASPPTTGFSLLGWIMPFIGLGIGLAVVAVWMKRSRGPHLASAPAAQSHVDERYRERIEKEMTELD